MIPNKYLKCSALKASYIKSTTCTLPNGYVFWARWPGDTPIFKVYFIHEPLNVSLRQKFLQISVKLDLAQYVGFQLWCTGCCLGRDC